MRHIQNWVNCKRYNFFFDKVNNLFTIGENPIYKSYTKNLRTYTKLWFSTKETQSSIQMGTSWVHQKEARNQSLLYKSYSTPSNALLFRSFQIIHIIAKMQYLIPLYFYFPSWKPIYAAPPSLCPNELPSRVMTFKFVGLSSLFGKIFYIC